MPKGESYSMSEKKKIAKSAENTGAGFRVGATSVLGKGKKKLKRKPSKKLK